MLRSDRIALIGPNGVGKSTVGDSLRTLGYLVVDVDEEFKKRVSDIGTFLKHFGGKAYVQTNAHLIRTLYGEYESASLPVIFVYGGGSFLHPEYVEITRENYRYMSSRALIIALLADENRLTSQIVSTLIESSRPYKIDVEETMKRNYRQMVQYTKDADFVVRNEGTPLTTAKRIDRIIRKDVEKVKNHKGFWLFR